MINLDDLQWVARDTPKSRNSKTRWRLKCAAGEWELAIRRGRRSKFMAFSIFKITKEPTTGWYKYDRLRDGFDVTVDLENLKVKLIGEYIEPEMKLKYLEQLT
jgi:hypothetical protein